MKKLITLIALTSSLATAAFAAPSNENVQVTNKNGRSYVVFTALAKGAATDLFNVFDKAGFSALHHVEGTTFQSKNIESSVFYLNGARYSTTLTIDPATSKVNVILGTPNTTVQVKGEMAMQLFEALKKAGVTQKGIHAIGAETLTSGALTCTAIENARPNLYSCSIEVSSVK